MRDNTNTKKPSKENLYELILRLFSIKSPTNYASENFIMNSWIWPKPQARYLFTPNGRMEPSHNPNWHRNKDNIIPLHQQTAIWRFECILKKKKLLELDTENKLQKRPKTHSITKPQDEWKSILISYRRKAYSNSQMQPIIWFNAETRESIPVAR